LKNNLLADGKTKIADLVGMDTEHRLAVHLLDLLRGDELVHANLRPLGLLVPQHHVQGTQQRADVALLTLDPVTNLLEDLKTNRLLTI